MITPAWVQTMAGYNAWQNRQLTAIVNAMPQAELDQDRGAFFGSIQRTLSHLLWGDLLWMSRFDPTSPAPGIPPADSVTAFATRGEWEAERFRCDGRIRIWAGKLRQLDLSGDFTWTYSYEDTEATKPMGQVVTHFFNHQTHHRGQVHAMLTAAGQDAPVSDLSYLPEEA